METIVAEAVDLFAERGIIPPVFISSNMDVGDGHNEKMLRQYGKNIRDIWHERMTIMLIDRFFDEVTKLTRKIQEEQKDNILKASTLIVDSLGKGGAVHVFDTGHLIDSEMISRAGGLLLMRALRYTFSVDSNVRARDKKGKDTSLEGLARYVLNASNVLAGDVLIIGSVSGKTVRPVDLAMEAKKMGVRLIAITSLPYSSALTSEHSSGKKLYELADVVIDNCAPVGDGMMETEGLKTSICPASGIAAAYIMWALTADIIDRLLEKGITPSVFKSINLPDGYAFLETVEPVYSKSGY